MKIKDVIRKFDLDEIWFLEQILQSTYKPALIRKLNEYMADSAEEADMVALEKSILSKVEALSQEEFEMLYEELATNTYITFDLN